jgi:hypothetical protein
MLICGRCLGEGSVIHGSVRIPCVYCDERGYKMVGEELEVNDE